jgi:hypothetical protein
MLEIPPGERVTILHYNLSMDGFGDVTVSWNGGKYTVQATKDDFEAAPSRYQPVRSFRKGQLYRFKSGSPSPLVNNHKVVGTVQPDDFVMFLGFRLWKRGGESGYEFEVIHKEEFGWVGEGMWPTLEELRET